MADMTMYVCMHKIRQVVLIRRGPVHPPRAKEATTDGWDLSTDGGYVRTSLFFSDYSCCGCHMPSSEASPAATAPLIQGRLDAQPLLIYTWSYMNIIWPSSTCPWYIRTPALVLYSITSISCWRAHFTEGNQLLPDLDETISSSTCCLQVCMCLFFTSLSFFFFF